MKRTINFGVIGCGLMGREFASAAARWLHLLDLDFQPRIVAACDTNTKMLAWFWDNLELSMATDDYRALLQDDSVEAIYCAVPHNLHEQMYTDIIQSGKHLLAEKPFGIDLAANLKIMEAVRSNPSVLVRCSSEFPFYPGAQQIAKFARQKRFGLILEVHAGFHHSSDMDPNKPINWKRQIATNGEYGCMGDLGMHVLHMPLRFGWKPVNVRALLSNVVKERPCPGDGMVACETWDNAVLACEGADGEVNFPMILEMKRIAPGETNTWFIRVSGTALSAEFSTKYPKTLRTLSYSPGGEQAWKTEDLGYKSAYSAITGGIFEFGFPDAMLQMWAAFCDELVNKDEMSQPFRCATPEEAHQSHLLFTAALNSDRKRSTEAL